MENLKISVPMPKKTGLELLSDMFEMSADCKKSACVMVLRNQTAYPTLDFWRLGRDGIAAGFLSVPVFDLVAIKKKMLSVKENFTGLEREKFSLTREEYGEQVACSPDPRLLVGDFNQLTDNGQFIGRDKILVAQWSLRGHPLINLCFDGFFTIESSFLQGYLEAIDVQLTYCLTVGRLGAETKYLFTSSLTELSFPFCRGWRARDHSFDLEEICHRYKTLDCQLEPTSLMRELWAAGRVNKAIRERQDRFNELFVYWKELGKELDRLNAEYISRRKGGK